MSVEKFSFYEAGDQCAKLGARLATTGELYLAWQAGMDVCNAGWLGDRSVRYPINIARPQCGGGLLGVRTIYLFPNQTGYPYPDSRYDAICFQGKHLMVHKRKNSLCWQNNSYLFCKVILDWISSLIFQYMCYSGIGTININLVFLTNAPE